ncbi:MAG: hypothetical protein CW691_06115 [Candidatus Bathyarchaeum sp.]|nr:MAG: hypothetical protein CW691_06115 [Candidatus Bathyarchaeum sp.]
MSLISQWRRTIKYSQRFIRDKHFRSNVLYMWSKTADTETKNQVVDEQLKKALEGKKIFFIGGCELSFLKEHLEKNVPFETLHTFDYGAASNPVFEVNDEQSELLKFSPDIVVLSHNQQIRSYIQAIQLQKVTYQDQEAQIQEIKTTFEDTIKTLRKKGIFGPIIIFNYPLMYRPGLGAFEYHSIKTGYSLIEFLAKLQLTYYEVAKKFNDVFVLNAEQVFANEGKNTLIRKSDSDGIYEHPSRKGSAYLGDELFEVLRIYYKIGKKIKCIVTDLDNTLWQGIIQDDGVSGVNLLHYRLRILQMLHRRGIILTIASKNDPSLEPQVNQVLGKYQNIFTLKKISWNDKAQSIHEIATELNIGKDSIAFFDDDPFNLDQVRNLLPEVSVYFPDKILDTLQLPEFDPGITTEEAKKRGIMYEQQKKRKEDESNYRGSKEEFLKSIDMKLWIREASERDLHRVTDLIGRTNQLNATIIRFKKPEIINFHKSKNHKIYVTNVWDKYGEYGLSGVAIVEENKETKEWSLISFLFSCRVMGKTVEQNTLAFIQREAKKNGIKKIVGQYKKTGRNSAIKRVFEEANFQKQESKDDFQQWAFNLEEQTTLEYSEWIKLLKSEP